MKVVLDENYTFGMKVVLDELVFYSQHVPPRHEDKHCIASNESPLWPLSILLCGTPVLVTKSACCKPHYLPLTHKSCASKAGNESNFSSQFWRVVCL